MSKESAYEHWLTEMHALGFTQLRTNAFHPSFLVNGDDAKAFAATRRFTEADPHNEVAWEAFRALAQRLGSDEDMRAQVKLAELKFAKENMTGDEQTQAVNFSLAAQGVRAGQIPIRAGR